MHLNQSCRLPTVNITTPVIIPAAFCTLCCCCSQSPISPAADRAAQAAHSQSTTRSQSLTGGLGTMRSLLAVVAAAAEHAHEHAGHSHGAAAAAAPAAAAAAAAEPTVSTLDLRIAAIFVIWAGAVLFGLPTLVFKQFRSADALLPRLLRSFAGGTIVALALVHIVPEAVELMDGLLTYHVAGCTILFGIVVLVLVDNSLAAFLTPEPYKQHIRDTAAVQQQQQLQQQPGSCHGQQSGRQPSPVVVSPSAAAAGGSGASVKQQPYSKAAAAAGGGSADGPSVDLAVDLDAIKSAATQSHAHQCLRSLNATGWVSSAAAPMVNVRQYVTAYTMELGCIFHSVIIGVGVGVITDDRQLVVTLMVALAIHQGLEALALGSVLALTSFPTAKKAAMLTLYTITTPIGVAIGIAIAATYNPKSVTSRAVQGTFNGVSAGMLLYIGMYQLIAEEFSREDLLVRPRLRLGMYAALLAGAACMCVLGIWS